MLNKDVFFKGMEKLVIFFPTWNIRCEDTNVMKSWYKSFEKCSDKSFIKMVNEYINNEKFNPTVCSLKEHYKNNNSEEKYNVQGLPVEIFGE